MESYIIRICRRENDRQGVAGVVEVVETQEKKPFRTSDELLAILNKKKRPGAKTAREKK